LRPGARDVRADEAVKVSRRLSDENHRRDPRLAAYVEDIHALLGKESCVDGIVDEVAVLTRKLLREWAITDARYLAKQPGCRYGSYLLYRAADYSFVVVIDTFDQGQTTQIHNHRTWGVVGLIDGAERNELYYAPPGLDGPPRFDSEHVTRAGEVVTMLETAMHRLATDQGAYSKSFHVYGADVGTTRRLAWNEKTRRYFEFRQGWSNDAVGLPIYLDCPALTDAELRKQCLGYL
jgi:predicted metal-dependent enzyme (double-stranded beta helix superfamily)